VLEFRPGRPLVFNHIPKTAGTSLWVALVDALQPELAVQRVDLALYGGYDDLTALRPESRALLVVRPDELPAEATLVGGHISPGTTMARYPEGEHLTILRAPQVRLLSQFLHNRSMSELRLRHLGATADTIRAGWLPLKQYLDHAVIAPVVDNAITRFLVWPHPRHRPTEFIDESDDDALFDAAVERLDNFAFVDVVENHSFFDRLGEWMGGPLQPRRLNDRAFFPKRRRPQLDLELDGSTRELLAHRSRIDERVWMHVARSVMPDSELNRMLDHAMSDATRRYDKMLREPDDTPVLRRVIEGAYELRVGIGHRRGSVFRGL
jgi:hypothetical protein